MTPTGQRRGRSKTALSYLSAGCCFLVVALSLPALCGPKLPNLQSVKTSRNLRIAEDAPARKDIVAAINAFREFEDDREEGPSLKAVISRLENAAVRASKTPQLYYYLGIAYQYAEKYPRAKSRLERAIKLNPDFYEAYTEYADVFQWQKDYKQAIEQYDVALDLNPEYDVALERKSYALIRLGKFEEAKNLVEKAQEIDEKEKREPLLRRLNMALKGPSWEETFVCETDNFIVKTSVSNRLAERLGEAAESIRRAYTKVFPKTKRPDRKFLVLVHNSRREYVRNGGPRQAGGHYEPDFRILQLFKYPKHDDTVAVLNHEAFHQFIHDYIERAPQWFNEGVADYFGAFEYRQNRERVVPRPNSDRLRVIKSAIRRKICPPPTDLMLMTQAEMYDPKMAGIYYAQAWSLVYFMLEGKKPRYRRVLSGYFRALLKGKDIEEAYKQTFAKINMKRFEREWKSFTNSIQ